MSTFAPAVKESPPSESGDSEASDILDLKDDEGWEDAEPEEENEKIISLVDSEVFPDILSMLEYCKTKHDLDFLGIRSEYSLDFYGNIKLVNFIRSEVKDGKKVTSTIQKADFEDDKYLKPFLEDDALLFNLDELPDLSSADKSIYQGIDKDSSSEGPLLARVAELEEELRRSQSHFAEYRDTVKQTLDDRWNENTPGPSNAADKVDKRDDDTHYFSSYSYNDIHETMLKDTVRTDAYRDFIYQNKHLFAGKTVLDVGCGTGILSMFCAKAGAARVIAVDNSAIIDKARENVFMNGFADKITCLHGKMEEVKLPVEHVDIIVSEWMGYCLLYEAMLDSVIWARDKYLRPEGLMVPSHMNMWIAPVADPEYVTDHIAFWRDVYGFDMKAMQAGIHDEGLVLHMPTKTIVGDPHMFQQLSLHTTTVKDLQFKREWKATLTEDIDSLDGFCIWFDTFFLPSNNDTVAQSARAEDWVKAGGKGVAFTTGPYGKETHWRQGVLLIDSTKEGSEAPRKRGNEVAGVLEYVVPEENSRALDVKISWSRSSGEAPGAQSWKMK